MIPKWSHCMLYWISSMYRHELTFRLDIFYQSWHDLENTFCIFHIGILCITTRQYFNICIKKAFWEYHMLSNTCPYLHPSLKKKGISFLRAKFSFHRDTSFIFFFIRMSFMFWIMKNGHATVYEYFYIY